MTDKYAEIAANLQVVPKDMVVAATENEITMPNFYKWSVNLFKWSEDSHRHLANVPEIAEALKQAFDQGVALGQRKVVETPKNTKCLSKLHGGNTEVDYDVLSDLVQRLNKDTLKWELYNTQTKSKLAIRNNYEPFHNVAIDKDH